MKCPPKLRKLSNLDKGTWYNSSHEASLLAKLCFDCTVPNKSNNSQNSRWSWHSSSSCVLLIVFLSCLQVWQRTGFQGGQHILRGEEVTLVRFKLIFWNILSKCFMYLVSKKSTRKCWLTAEAIVPGSYPNHFSICLNLILYTERGESSWFSQIIICKCILLSHTLWFMYIPILFRLCLFYIRSFS